MIELVPMAYRVVNEVDAVAATSEDRAVSREKEGDAGSMSVASGRTGGPVIGGGGKKMDEDEERDAVFFRLESLGYRVGQGLVERYVCPYSHNGSPIHGAVY